MKHTLTVTIETHTDNESGTVEVSSDCPTNDLTYTDRVLFAIGLQEILVGLMELDPHAVLKAWQLADKAERVNLGEPAPTTPETMFN